MKAQWRIQPVSPSFVSRVPFQWILLRAGDWRQHGTPWPVFSWHHTEEGARWAMLRSISEEKEEAELGRQRDAKIKHFDANGDEI